MAKKVKSLSVTCTGSGLVDWHELQPIQGKLKVRTQADVDKIVNSLLKFGFSFPFFVWQHDGVKWCLDGHGRLEALRVIEEQGYTVPMLPFAEVQARSVEEAKQKLLRLVSVYGKVTAEGVHDFLDGITIDFEELALPAGELALIVDDDFSQDINWDGMPEFEQQDKEAYKSVLVNFASQESVDAFAKLVAQNITEKTRSIWFPKVENFKASEYEYATTEK